MNRKTPSLTRRDLLAGATALAALGMAPLRAAAAFDAAGARRRQLAAPDGRVIEIWDWQPRGRVRGLVTFSHGAASAPWKYPPFITAWVAAGYRVVAPLHVDSTDHPDTAKFAGFRSWRARLEDMRAIGADLGDTYIATGHSYGGLTALVQGGAQAVVPDGVIAPLRDARVRAVVAFSPPAPIPGLIEAAGYATLAVPALIQTGTADVPPGVTQPDGWRGHLVPYEAAAADGSRYGLVLEGADHYFGGEICRPELPGPKQTTQVREAARLSLLFMDAYGRGQGRARRALQRQLADSGPVRLARR